MADRRQQIQNILSDLGAGFKADYELGREDRRNAFLRGRKLKDQTEESTKWDSMIGTHPGINRMAEAMGRLPAEDLQALREFDMNLRGSTAHKTGQFLGSAANDITQDATRSIYWLLNAAQATGAYYKNKHAGTFGNISAFSTHPLKNLSAIGDAGYLTTNNYKYYKKCKSLINHGMENRNVIKIRKGLINIYILYL
mgnify:CR=1 FL=1